MPTPGTIAIIILVILILAVIVSCIQIVQQSKAYVVERLGAFHSVWGVGLHFKLPFIERVVKKVSLKEQVADFDPQPVITKDNVTFCIITNLNKCCSMFSFSSMSIDLCFNSTNLDVTICCRCFNFLSTNCL